MIIFVNNIEIHIKTKSINEGYSNNKNSPIDFNNIQDDTLFHKVKNKEILDCIEYLQAEKKQLSKIGFVLENRSEFKKHIKTHTHFIEAAGGVVQNEKQEILMIKRLGLWDLPKGKAEKEEKSIETAEREVTEECGVEVKATEKITTSWHTYITKKGLALKRTRWYAMELISDENMTPQTEEDIEELAWMAYPIAYQHSKNSYRSIQYVLEQFELIKSGL